MVKLKQACLMFFLAFSIHENAAAQDSLCIELIQNINTSIDAQKITEASEYSEVARSLCPNSDTIQTLYYKVKNLKMLDTDRLESMNRALRRKARWEWIKNAGLVAIGVLLGFIAAK